MSGNTSCILVVGSTGTGKSTLIGLCTGVPVNTSGGTSECTLDIKEFREKDNEAGPVWIDSVGFDGTDSKRSDEEAFQYILKFLQDKKISHVVGIIWTVNPDDREAAKLQEQAKLINKFKEGVVWNNVIIAVKKTRGNARRDGAGALAAAGRLVVGIALEISVMLCWAGIAIRIVLRLLGMHCWNRWMKTKNHFGPRRLKQIV
jgi:energy-coupling factor transporter ATP-binding protein EcfA2